MTRIDAAEMLKRRLEQVCRRLSPPILLCHSVISEIILCNSLGDILRNPLTPFCRSQRELIPCGACRPGLGFLLRFFNVSFSKRFVWGSRRPADYDQKDIEDEERNGNVVEESRLG
jgi:hypothetical protein